MTRYLLAAFVAVFAFTMELKAADPVGPKRIIAPVQAQADDVITWNRTGFYVAGIAAYDVTVFQSDDIGEAASGKLMGGAALGWNWRVAQQFMLGFEVDWMLTGIAATTLADEVTIKASTDHLVSIRGRAGVPLGPALLYFTAGPAWQNVKLTVGETSGREWQLGAAFGGGAEVELSRGLALRLEALHYIFPNDGAPLSALLDSENQHTAVRGGLVFKLN